MERKKLKSWFKENNGKTIFFYPTNKIQQEKIKDEIADKLKDSIAQTYYEGPKLIGDIKNKYVIRFMLKPLNMKSPNQPKFLSVSTDGLNLICNLEEFMEDEYDKNKLNKLIGEMNAYA